MYGEFTHSANSPYIFCGHERFFPRLRMKGSAISTAPVVTAAPGRDLLDPTVGAGTGVGAGVGSGNGTDDGTGFGTGVGTGVGSGWAARYSA